MTYVPPQDGRLIAEHNESQILYWINRFGGLTTCQLAHLHWHQMPSALRMAQRTVQRLEQNKMLLRRRIFTGGCIYVLSERSAAFLLERGFQNVSARGHRDLTFDKPTHRIIANNYVIDQLLNGCQVWTEFEIQRGLAPNPEIYVRSHSRSTNDTFSRRKIPDALVESQGRIDWIEVENSPKSKSRIYQMLLVAKQLLSSPDSHMIEHNGNHYMFDRVTFVLPNDRTLRSLMRAIDSIDLPFDILYRIYLQRVEMSSGLIWGGVTFNYTADELLSIMHGTHLD